MPSKRAKTVTQAPTVEVITAGAGSCSFTCPQGSVGGYIEQIKNLFAHNEAIVTANPIKGGTILVKIRACGEHVPTALHQRVLGWMVPLFL